MKQKNVEEIDVNKSYFHFTETKNLPSIEQYGLKAQVGDASQMVDDKPRVCLSKGGKGILGIKDSFIRKFKETRICDIPEGYKKYFNITDFTSTKLIPPEVVYEGLQKRFEDETYLVVDAHEGEDFLKEEVHGMTSESDVKGKENHDISADKISKLITPEGSSSMDVIKYMYNRILENNPGKENLIKSMNPEIAQMLEYIKNKEKTMGKLKLDNTNSFGAAGYTMNWVHSPKSTFGGIFKNELAVLETGIMDFRFAQLGDVEDAYDILKNKLSKSGKNEFEDCMKYIAETVQEYFGDYSNVGSRLENYPDEDDVNIFSMERGKVSDLRGKNAAMCVERAMLSQNLLKYVAEKLPGLESYFKETGIEIQKEEGKTKTEAHAFNLVSYNGKYYIFDATIPKGTKDNLQPIVAEIPENVFTSMVESPREGYAVELEHISALTGKKMHYTLDYKAKSKYDSKLARKKY